jgi:Transposase DNA-binding
MRRTARAVKAATRMAENPSATLPAHMQTWKETMALYRLLDEEDVTEDRADAASLAPDPRTH